MSNFALPGAAGFYLEGHAVQSGRDAQEAGLSLLATIIRCLERLLVSSRLHRLMLRKTAWVAAAMLLALSVVHPTAANASCAVPQQLSNGQVADASAVMDNFNALKTCVDGALKPFGTPTDGGLAGFTSQNTVGSVNLNGDCTTSGSLATTCSKSGGVPLGYFATGTDAAQLTGSISVNRFSNGAQADGQHFLRGDGVWALPPGAAAEGSRLNPYVPTGFALNVVAASGWTQTLNATSVTATLTDLAAGRGISYRVTPASGYRSGKLDLIGYAPPAAGSDFSIVTLMSVGSIVPPNWIAGLQVTDSAGKFEVFGIRNGNNLFAPANFRYTNIENLTTTTSYSQSLYSSIFWLRLERQGGNFVFSVSNDGESYDTVAVQSSTAFLNASLVSVGLLVGPNNGKFGVSVFHFSHS